LNLELQVLEMRRREDVAGAVRAAPDSQAEALNVFSSPVLSSLHREIITFAAEYRLPLLGRIGARAKMQFPIHPHMLRHGCGYALANPGHDTRALQAWLGHKNIQHTVRYTESPRIGSRISSS
jgi:integrase